MDNNISLLLSIVLSAKRTVFFGGAGVSTASGIPDFRSHRGLYQTIGVEKMLSADYFCEHTEDFYKYYLANLVHLTAVPNDFHLFLAQLEKIGKLSAVITQNIDGLHQAAGSKKVLELHGSIHRNFCLDCRREFDAEYLSSFGGVPQCPSCGGLIKPNVVLYGESLNADVVDKSVAEIELASTLIAAGTSLSVYPAASLLDYFHGEKLILLNRDPGPADGRADLIIRTDIGQAGTELLTAMSNKKTKPKNDQSQVC